MLRLLNIKLPLSFSQKSLLQAAAAALQIPQGQIARCVLARKSVDARKKSDICLICALDVTLKNPQDEPRIAARIAPASGGMLSPDAAPPLPRLPHAPQDRPVVVGFGPAGLFAALTLAEAGARPLVLERGQDVRTRTRDVQAYWEHGASAFSPASNVQFGEGGAGTFSDGKLNTGTKDPRASHVLRTFVRFGAPKEILIDAKPHIGTDRLADVVRAMRLRILELGGDVRFGARMTRLVKSGNRIGAVRWEDSAHREYEVPARHVLLAIGHSARDTFTMLHEQGFTLIQKPFSIGARIEHPQALIDRAQYGAAAGHPALGAADYKLSLHLKDGRGVYTFCMCPGGVVVAAASEPDTVVTNGMSVYARDGKNANSALLVGIGPQDFGSSHPLAGMFLQREIERRAFELGGRTGHAPCQRVEDLLLGRPSTHIGSVTPSYQPGVVPGDLAQLLPPAILSAMREAIPLFGRRLHGFDLPDAILTGPETRSSSPVRILRGESLESIDASGLFPCGEGAGYAGGIMSAAVDGIRCAEAILSQLV